ncbi:CG12716 [Drosophila busckii]|uniref:CG12716 n=1 Tax=Drosophila busckii TaxID=30019 RepID=A0A0M4F866_DROBS|nr:mucin-5AC [Drosophila busckii]ALC48512.1 CG12716 [Drosophila busckii]
MRAMKLQKLVLWAQLLSLAIAEDPWQYNNPHYANAQYVKMLTGNNNKEQEAPALGNLQYQYVDYQPNCRAGVGEPVCATDGKTFHYFENDCKLEAHNMKLLFQYGHELEPTEMERCLPNCENIKCTTHYEPVCAAAVDGQQQGQGITFGNECEVQRRQCVTQQTFHILNKGICQPSKQKRKSRRKSKGKRKLRRKSSKTTSTSTTSTTTTEMPIESHFYDTLTTTSTTSATPASHMPMQFRQYLGLANSDVSVSRAVNAYSVYNIDDVGLNYGAITDSSLSLYLPGIGTVTDTPPSTTSTTTTTTTTTTTPKPSTTTVENEVKYFYMPFTKPTSTSTSSTTSTSTTNATPTTTAIATTDATTTALELETTTLATIFKPQALAAPQIAQNATATKSTTESIKSAS